MIRKMLAMLVAISCAFGAWADTHISGTDFTGLTAGPFVLGLDDSGESTGTNYWYNGDTSDFEGTIVTDGLANFLDFESNITNPLYRTINNCNGATSPSQFQTTPIGTGLFIDTHVQFTPYLVNENHPAPTGSGEDKLIVWVRETEVDGDANLTNLIVTAGYVAGNGIVTASNYVINLSQAQASDLCSGQHRLTIKSYENITDYNSQGVDYYIMGFVVYIDEAVVDYPDASIALNVVPGPRQYYSTDGHNKLFASLMPAGSGTISNYSKLSAVGYAGMGKIGDVIFDSYNTTYPAFAGDDLSFEVRPGDGVTSFDYLGVTYNGGTNCFFTVDATTASVTISNVLYDTTAGYTHKTGTWHNNVAVDNQVGEGGDYGTFYFANGTILTLVGFQANYIVNGVEFDTLLGENGALAAALADGYPLVLNNDVEITEGDGCLYLGSGDTLVLDLKGHTIKGTGDEYTPTIINNGGTLTIVDTSSNQDGKVLNNDNSNLCLGSYSGSTTTLNAGIYEEVDELDGDLTTITINGGTYRDVVYGPDAFYMSSCIATGKQIVDWIQDGDNNYYAVIGEGGPTGYFPQSSIEEQWADRKGTAAKPYAIRSLADFEGLRSDLNDGYNTNKYFEVVVDNITLTEWEGVGSSSKPFSGTLIGGGKTVNVTFKAGKKDNGLFAYVRNATISNLTVNVTAGAVSGETGGAAFVGKAAGSCTFVALKATGSLGTSETPTTHNTAGICERIDTDSVGANWVINFNSCTNEMTIYANYTKAGGILGFRDGGYAEVNFNNCVNSANINNDYATSGQYGTGGIMGWTGGTNLGTGITRINGCVNTGTITAAYGSVGNFLGYENYQATALGTNIGLASLKPSGSSYITGLNWATVDGDLATFVTPVTTVSVSASYKVMQSNAVDFVLAAVDASLTIDTSLAPYIYTGTVSVDESLAEDYNLRETAIANGTIYSLESKTPADPWAPTEQTDAAASNKVVEIFGEGSDVANHVTTLAQYEALVTYIKSVTSQSEVPTDLTPDQKTWMWKSFILGANPLFEDEPAVQITSLTAGATAGLWDFTVKVTEGDDTDAYNVAADKVGALVKISSSLTSGTWVAPTAGNISAVKLLGGNLIQVEVNFGDGTSGFMKVSE